MRKRWKVSKNRSRKMFKKSAYPVKRNNRNQTGMGIKRGGTRL